MLDPSFGSKPCRVQRTSSVDTRQDVSQHTWTSLLSLLDLHEYFVTVDHFSIWRKHLSWAKDGVELRKLTMERFSTNMVFMSLLLGAELSVLFDSSKVTTQMRVDMHSMNYGTMKFWIGLTITMSVVLTLLSLLSTFTAWGMISSISGENAHCVLRSSIGQYICYLPSRLIVTSIYSFLIWMVGFLFILLPGFCSWLLLAIVLILFFHIVMVFSAFGRLIMHTGGMGSSRIFDPDFEQELLPRGLHTSLLFKAVDELRKGTSVTRQYKHPAQPIGHVDSAEKCVPSHSGTVRFSDTAYPDMDKGENRIRSNGTKKSHTPTKKEGGNVPSITPTAMEQWVLHDATTTSGSPDVSIGASLPPKSFLTTKGNSECLYGQPCKGRSKFPPEISARRDNGLDSLPGVVRSVLRQRSLSEGSLPDCDRRSRAQHMDLASALNASNHTSKSFRRLASELSCDLSDLGKHEAKAPMRLACSKLHGGSPCSKSEHQATAPRPHLKQYQDPCLIGVTADNEAAEILGTETPSREVQVISPSSDIINASQATGVACTSQLWGTMENLICTNTGVMASREREVQVVSPSSDILSVSQAAGVTCYSRLWGEKENPTCVNAGGMATTMVSCLAEGDGITGGRHTESGLLNTTTNEDESRTTNFTCPKQTGIRCIPESDDPNSGPKSEDPSNFYLNLDPELIGGSYVPLHDGNAAKFR